MNMKLPSILETKLSDFRRRVWAVKLAEGLLAALFGVGLSYLLVFALDRFFETPAALRWIILIVGAATLGLGLPLKWHRWV
jgi:cobalamin biosynthesis protein CobD/CbiB